MIRNDSEYSEAVARPKEEKKRLESVRTQLREEGLDASEIERVVDPLESFHLQLAEEVSSYERLKRGEFNEIRNLEGLGQLLIALRIAQGLSQRALAERLGVHESQVSRDEGTSTSTSRWRERAESWKRWESSCGPLSIG